MAWKEIARFTVQGDPKPGGSKSYKGMSKAGKAIIVDACKGNKSWRESVKWAGFEAYQGELIRNTAIQLEITFLKTRPQSHFGSGRNADKLKASAPSKPLTRPDATKLTRSTEDALTGVIWYDDSLITDQHIYRRYADRPGAEIVVSVEAVDALGEDE